MESRTLSPNRGDKMKRINLPLCSRATRSVGTFRASVCERGNKTLGSVQGVSGFPAKRRTPVVAALPPTLLLPLSPIYDSRTYTVLRFFMPLRHLRRTLMPRGCHLCVSRSLTPPALSFFRVRAFRIYNNAAFLRVKVLTKKPTVRMRRRMRVRMLSQWTTPKRKAMRNERNFFLSSSHRGT